MDAKVKRYLKPSFRHNVYLEKSCCEKNLTGWNFPTCSILGWCTKNDSVKYYKYFTTPVKYILPRVNEENTKRISNKHQKNTKSIPKEHQKNNKQIPREYQGNTKRVPKEYQTNTKRIPKWYQKNTKWIPRVYQENTKGIPK